MLNLYLFKIKEVNIFVAAPTWKKARNHILHLPEFKNNTLTEIKGTRVNLNCAEAAGIIEIGDVFEKMSWWTCRCGERSFIALDNGKACRCKNCGREQRLHF